MRSSKRMVRGRRQDPFAFTKRKPIGEHVLLLRGQSPVDGVDHKGVAVCHPVSVALEVLPNDVINREVGPHATTEEVAFGAKLIIPQLIRAGQCRFVSQSYFDRSLQRAKNSSCRCRGANRQA